MDALLDQVAWSPISRSWDGHEEGEDKSSSESSAQKVTTDFYTLSNYGASRATISEFKRTYEFRNGLKVEDFLKQNVQESTSLRDVLREAPVAIRHHFGSDVRLVLEVIEDPEYPSDKQLFLLVKSRFPVEVKRTLLNYLDAGWWFKASGKTGGKLEIDTE